MSNYNQGYPYQNYQRPQPNRNNFNPQMNNDMINNHFSDLAGGMDDFEVLLTISLEVILE